MKTIWSFDLGKASIGEAVRDLSNHSFPHKDSLLMPEDFAETRTAAGRRRMQRTREAHKAREAWLDTVWRAAAIQEMPEPLTGRRVEERDGEWQSVDETSAQKKQRELLEREFPKKGDTTCYNSALLRIKLLRGGEKLEPWQIYKALHSAIQKRGYGRVPWAARDERRIEGKSEEELDAALLRKDEAKLTADERIYRETITAWGKFRATVPEPFHYPCYYDAAKMKLWKPTAPDALVERIDCHAESTRRVRFAREDVEKEIAALARNAAAQLPALAEMFARVQRDGWTLRTNQSGRIKTFPVVAADIGAFLVHGPAGDPLGAAENDFAAYLDFRTEHGIHPGSTDDWMGATGQKTPRFDNRIINDCALLDGHQVCNVAVRYDTKNARPYADSLLVSEVTFLMKLKNTLVEGEKGQRKLKPKEIEEIFRIISAKAHAKLNDVKDYSTSVIKCYALTESAWGSAKGIKELALRPLKGHQEIKAPKTEGRSRFSRPALRLIRALILSGEKPSEFKRRLLARDATLLAEVGMDVLAVAPSPRAKVDGKTEPQRHPYILESHLKFLTDLARANDTWEALHIPEQRLEALEERHKNDGIIERDAAIREIIGSINDPIVRHRLGVFAGRLQDLHGRFGVPEEIVIEFIRTDFMGAKAKLELAVFQKKREEARIKAREQVGKADALKYELAAAQGCLCLYCGQPFQMSELGNYEVEHIVPRKQGGPDAMVNYVLAHRECNTAKADQTPFEWLRPSGKWDAYVERVEACATALRNKKVQLLQREDARELVDRYTALAETAWISRLAQKVAGLHFGWRNGNDADGNKRVTVISGGLTARVRRKYRLNSLLLLSSCPPGEDEKEWEAKAEKNRGDKRHHALDAMVINFLPQWSRDAHKEHFFRFPDSIQKNAQAFFRKEIGEVMPRNIALKKPTLEEKFYGKRANESKAAREKRGRSVSMVRRLEDVGDLPYKSVNKKKVFDVSLETAYTRIENIRDETVRKTFASYFNSHQPAEEDWHKKLEEGFFHPNGSRIRRLLLDRGSPDEYGNFAKDGTDAWRRGEPHRGQIVYLLRTTKKKGAVKETIEVRPVYVFESRGKVEAKLREEHGEAITLYGFFQSGCLIAVEREVAHKKKSLPAGTYLLNTIMADSKCMKLTTQNGRTYPDIPRYSVASLIAAGLRRVD